MTERVDTVDAPVPGSGAGRTPVTKSRLVEAGRALMIERNAVDFSLQDVAARSGLNSALVKYHFGNKDGLLLAILEQDAGHAVAQMRKLSGRDMTATAKLAAHVRGVIETYHRRPYMNRLVHLAMHELGPQAADQVAQFFVTPLVAFQRELLAKGVETGEFRPVEPVFFYHSVIGACEHLFVSQAAMRRVFGEQAFDDDLCRRYSAHVVDLVSRGVLRDGGEG